MLFQRAAARNNVTLDSLGIVFTVVYFCSTSQSHSTSVPKKKEKHAAQVPPCGATQSLAAQHNTDPYFHDTSHLRVRNRNRIRYRFYIHVRIRIALAFEQCDTTMDCVPRSTVMAVHGRRSGCGDVTQCCRQQVESSGVEWSRAE